MNIRRSGGTLAVLSALALFAFAPRPAHADLIITTVPSSTTVGSSGTLEVTLTNTGPSASNIEGFSFEVSVGSGSGVTFTDATINTTPDPYVFAGNSTFGPDIATTTGITLDASDLAAAGFTSVASGSTVGLGEVFYTVGAGAAPGPVSVGFDDISGATSLSDDHGNAPTFIANAGTITILPASISTPEPSSITTFTIIALGLGGLLLKARRRSIA